MLLLLTLVAGCATKTFESAPATTESARPADSPPPSAAPAGVLRPLAGHPRAAIFDRRTAALAVLIGGPDPAGPASVAVLGREQTPPRIIDLPGPATAVTGDGAGTLYLSTRGGYFVVGLPDGATTRVDVGEAHDIVFNAITRRDDATMVLGAADGTVQLLPAHAGAHRVKVPLRVDYLVAQGNTVVALDREQSSVSAIGADGKIGQTLRAGRGATTMAADSAGRVLVADTGGGQLLVYGVDPLILRQAYPVPHSPYGLAGSARLTWVSQTGTNTVIGYDLSTGIPVEQVRYPTVRQPDSLALDETSDTLYVVSGSGAGVQVIEHAAGGR